MKIGILTSGGDCPGINATIRGVCKTAINHYGMEVYGIHSGFRGLLDNDIVPLDESSLTGLLNLGGTILGTSREKPFKRKAGAVSENKPAIMLQTIRERGLDCIVCIGGNGTQKTAAKLAEAGVNVVSIPKTIDNDLFGTDHCPGYASAAKYIATSMMELYQDARVYDKGMIVVVEIMGRHAGWLTAASALAGEYGAGPDLIYLPETDFSMPTFIEDVKRIYKETGNCIVAVSEGIHYENGDFVSEAKVAANDGFGHAQLGGLATILAEVLKEETGAKVRGIELNLLQRCAAHLASETDIEESYMAGKVAVENAVNGINGRMIGFERGIQDGKYACRTKLIPLMEVANVEKKIPREWINEAGNGVNHQFIEYALPLIQGEPDLPKQDSLPRFAKLKKVLAK